MGSGGFPSTYLKIVFSSPELSFYRASVSLSQATNLLHRSGALLDSFLYRKDLRKWIYVKIFQRCWVLLAIWNIPQILWISKSIALSHLLATAEMVYHQLLNFSFPSPRSDPSCVWRTQKRNQPFYKSHSLTCWERKKKEQKDFKIGPSRNKLNKHSVRQTNDPSRLSCFQ